ncbi:NIPSNAP protein [Catalinimonas alkaloidigena]|uniref:NIPSNAP protein n=1 Tax=Catalinimonas alkaloidigena TaxID=1075417 RepID=A0A1G9AXB7_9BACT|nr:NIPSNAP family protein [Catalinimonas alkaloidigena]SDK31892.1 NIPSNAP protein [Catalinimonas alkaloidigena]
MHRHSIFSLALGLIFSLFATTALSAPPKSEFYELKVYHFKDATQEKSIDQFLKDSYLPALHRAGIAHVGVFKPLANDTATDKRVYVLIPFQSLDKFAALPQTLNKDKAFQNSGQAYLSAAYNQPPYQRMESILMRAFTGMPQMALPQLTSATQQRVYELRSYEGPTEKLYANKVDMFNKGDEVGLFKRLGFNAVFYAEVLAGSHMPNLMYMTTFENMEERDKHWKAFGEDPAWVKLKSMPEYQNNVSHADIFMLRPTAYSDI